MKPDAAFSELLGLIYEGPLEAVPWQSFLSRFKEIMNASVTTLVLRPPTADARGVMLNDGGVMDVIASYNERLYALDPFVDLPPGKVVSLQEFIGTENLQASDFYRLCMEPSDLWDILGADMQIPGELEARFRVSRTRKQTRFTESEKRLCAAILPHLERSIRLHARMNRIESERALYAGAMGQLAVASILLDETGKVLNSNARADQLLAKGTDVLIRDGRLALQDKHLTDELHALVMAVLANQRQGRTSVVEALRVPRGEGQMDLGLVIRPVPHNEWSEGKAVPSVAIFISDPEDATEAPVQVITKLFGFTPTEATLAILLAKGLTLDEVADTLHVSRNTVRTHLRSVFAKTGVSRQGLLIRLILQSVAPLA
ncbi:MAG: helix-turn-helix transcriptional regulator [Gammaproteobacteria bacterium]|nr:MAG: helix-turn-helix transcriptional regulator [Gammaproteobacteria bacterium]